jgi:septal ring factor EnvC (AmiA/AmiB activator)
MVKQRLTRLSYRRDITQEYKYSMEKNNNIIIKVTSDWRNVAVIVLVAACLVLGWLTFFKSDSGYKERIKQLEKENSELVKERNRLTAEIASRKVEYKSLKNREAQLLTDLSLLQNETARLRADANQAKADLTAIQIRLRETREKIQKLKSNPANRKDEDLLNSLILKLK